MAHYVTLTLNCYTLLHYVPRQSVNGSSCRSNPSSIICFAPLHCIPRHSVNDSLCYSYPQLRYSTSLRSPTVSEWLIISLVCCLSSTVLCCPTVSVTMDVIISSTDRLHSSAYPVPDSREDIDEKLQVPSLIVGMISGKSVQLSCSRQSGRY